MLLLKKRTKIKGNCKMEDVQNKEYNKKNDIIQIGQKVSFEGDFVFFDVETANRNQEICQIGAIIVSNKRIIDVMESYIKPIGAFEYSYYKKHHIKPIAVENAPKFCFVWENYLKKYTDENFIFVCHNAIFDLTSVAKSLQSQGKNCSKIKYICTYELAKVIMKRHFKREALCDYFSLHIENNHNALSDSIDCFHIFNRFIDDYKIDYKKYLSIFNHKNYEIEDIPLDKTYDYFARHEANRFSSKKVNEHLKNEEEDIDFINQKITLTGTFSRYKLREDLAIELRNRGATIMSSLAKSTTILIAGTDPGKIDKARALGIRIINEETLYKMLDNGNDLLIEGGCDYEQ